MVEDEKTPTDKPPMPPIPAPAGEPTIDIEADAAGELREVPTVPAGPPVVPDELAKPELKCDAQCGTATAVRCVLPKGHELAGHPAYVGHPVTGEACHQSPTVRWPVDVEAHEAATADRNRQLLEDAQRLDREANEE
jgi:hypothetical protein